MIDIDWLDILLHIFFALVFVGILALAIGIAAWIAAALNALFWFGREAWQQRRKGKSVNPLNWSAQTLLEAVCPTIAGVLLAV